MVLERYREWVRPYLDRVARPFLGWSPNRLSATAIACAIGVGSLAAAVRWTSPLLFLPVSALVLLTGTFDVLDGHVARATGRSSPRGDFLDHVLDRYADVVILLGRADRLVVLALVAFLEFDWSLPWPWAPSEPWARFHLAGVEFTVIDVAMVYFIVAGQLTAFARARRTYRALPER